MKGVWRMRRSFLSRFVAAAAGLAVFASVSFGASIPKPVIKKIRPAVVDSEGGDKIHVRILVDCPSNWTGPSNWVVRFSHGSVGAQDYKYFEETASIGSADLMKGERELRVRFVRTKAQLETGFGFPGQEVLIEVKLHSMTPGMNSMGFIMGANRRTPWPLKKDLALALYYLGEIKKFLDAAKFVRNREANSVSAARLARYDNAIRILEAQHAKAARTAASKTVPSTRKADTIDDILDSAKATYDEGF